MFSLFAEFSAKFNEILKGHCNLHLNHYAKFFNKYVKYLQNIGNCTYIFYFHCSSVTQRSTLYKMFSNLYKKNQQHILKIQNDIGDIMS